MTLTLSYRSYGSGKPMIILHGLLGASNNWGSIAKQFSNSHQVFIVDARNHGRSPHTDSMDYLSMAQDVVDFMDQQNLEKATLLGHSMGGKIAMTVALQNNQRVDKLIVADIAPVKYLHGKHDDLVEAMQQLDLSQVKKREDADARLKDVITDVGVRLFLLQNLAHENGAYRWRCNLHVIRESLDNMYDFPEIAPGTTFSKKTLFVGGANSDYILRQYYSRIFQLFPKNQILLLNDAGHWVHADQPEAFLKTVQQFL